MATAALTSVGGRARLAVTRLLARMGLGEGSFLMLAAVLIGVITAAAAVCFHELIYWVRDWLYVRLDHRVNLYGRGVWVLVLLPTVGGLVVGLISNYVIRIREGRGIVDVLES